MKVDSIDSGLGITINNENGISIDMPRTTSECPRTEILPETVENKIYSVIVERYLPLEVNLVWEPSRSQELITARRPYKSRNSIKTFFV